MMIYRNNINGYGNDSFCKVLLSGQEDINTTPDPDEFVEESGNYSGYTMGANLPTQDSTTKKFGSKSWKFTTTSQRQSYLQIAETDQVWSFGDKHPFAIDFYFKVIGTRDSRLSSTQGLFYFVEASDIYHACYIEYGGVSGDTLKYIINYSKDQPINLEHNLGTSYDDTWYHVAITKNGTQDFRLFVDGDRKDYETYERDYNIQTALFVGQYDTTYPELWDGYTYIDNFRLSIGIGRWDRDFYIPNRAY